MWLLSIGTVWAEEPVAREFVEPVDPAELRAEAKARTTRGAVELGLGAAMLTGAGFTLLFDRGDPGELSAEPVWVMDVRSVGGGLLAVGGLTTMLLGGHDVGDGARLRKQADALTVGLTPVPLPGGAGLVIGARF